MAYVPPHKRVIQGQSSSVRPTPVAPPSGKQNRDRYGKQRGWKNDFKPDVDIKYARDSIRKWFAVAGVGNPSHLLLEFKPFQGESFEHLRDEKLYTLKVAPPVNGGVEDENSIQSLTITENQPWKYICETIKSDLQVAFCNVQNYLKILKPDLVKPTLAARFGEILFHGGGLDWHEHVSADALEKIFKGQRGLQKPVRKTFDTDIPKYMIEALKEKTIAILETAELKEKESYFIQVEDNLRLDVILGCTCVKKSKDSEQLEVEKIKMDPVRHFVADVSCLDKCMDLRLILVTERHLTELSEEDAVCIEGIVKSACILEGAKGGLHWPFGGDAVGNRFRVRGVWHCNVSTIIGKNWKLKLRHVNRTEFKASTGRVSYEAQLELRKLTGYLRDDRQWDEENVMEELEEILKWIWTECLQGTDFQNKPQV